MIPFPRYLIRPPIEYGRRDMHAGEFIPCSLAVSCLTEKSAPPYYWELPCNTMGLNPFRRSVHVFMYLYLISYHGIFSAKFFMNSGQNSDRNVTHNISCTLILLPTAFAVGRVLVSFSVLITVKQSEKFSFL